MTNKIKNLIITNKKFSIIYFILILFLLSILGNIERVGYLSEFNINVDKTLELNGLDIEETKQSFMIEGKLDEAAVTNFVLTNTSIANYNYNFRIKYHSKIFRNNDIYDVYPNLDNLPEYILSAKMNDNKGTPFGNLISTKIIDIEKIDNINYVLKLKNIFIFTYIILLILYACFVYRNKIYNFFIKIDTILRKNKILILKIYVSLLIIMSIPIIILALLGNIERVGYLSEFNINVDKTLELNGLDIEETKQLFMIEDELDEAAATNFVLTNTSIANYNYNFRIKYHSKIFRNNDIYDVYPNLDNLPEHILSAKMNDNKGTPFGNLISTKIIDIEKIDNINYVLKLKKDLIIYLLIFIYIFPIVYVYITRIKYDFHNNLIFLLIHSAIYLSIFYIILPQFLSSSFKFSFADFAITYISTIVVYNLLNKNKSLTFIFIFFQSFSLFIIEPISLTFQNTILLFTDMPNLYPTLINVLSLPMKIVTITATIIYFSAMILLIIALIYNIQRFRKKTILIVIYICISSYIIFFRPRDIVIWSVNFKNNANMNGIIDTINYKINYDKINNIKHSKKEVENALSFLIEKEKNRNVSNLLLKGSKYITEDHNKRDIFLIFLESFYDYSHFVKLFNKDPFPREYRKWANASQKISPNTGEGSFYARLSGLTASSPLYSKTQLNKLDFTLANLLLENGYNTIALEEAWHSYNLDNFLPSIGFQNTIFELGTTNIDSYIENNFNNLNRPIFLYGFTWLGHQGSHISNNFNIKNNNKNFFNLIQEKDIYNLIETMDNSVMAAMEIIKIRDTILKHSPNALIIFKHDHLYPYLRSIIENSSIDNDIKNSFLNDSTPTPILIWDGTNGAYKAPVNLMPENIPMFIAINAGVTNYKNSIISLLYKEEIDNTISTYHKYYKITNNSLILENNIDEDSDIFKYENAQKILSQDIFQGKKYYYELISDLEKTN